MQAILGGIKTLVILISNEMPDENTDQNTTQPPYRQLVSIKAKVARADAVKNRKLMIQCLTSKTCTSLIKLAQQFLWKKYVNSCEPGQTYIFKNLRLRQKADCRRLNTPKEEEIKVSFEEAPPFEGELASEDQLPPVTKVSQIAVIIGVTNVSSYKSCFICSKKVNKKSEKRGFCSRCNMDVSLKRCSTSWYLRPHMHIPESKQKLNLTVYHPAVEKIARLLQVELQSVDNNTLTDSILEMDEVLITYDSATKKLTDIELFSMKEQ